MIVSSTRYEWYFVQYVPMISCVVELGSFKCRSSPRRDKGVRSCPTSTVSAESTVGHPLHQRSIAETPTQAKPTLEKDMATRMLSGSLFPAYSNVKDTPLQDYH